MKGQAEKMQYGKGKKEEREGEKSKKKKEKENLFLFFFFHFHFSPLLPSLPFPCLITLRPARPSILKKKRIKGLMSNCSSTRRIAMSSWERATWTSRLSQSTAHPQYASGADNHIPFLLFGKSSFAIVAPLWRTSVDCEIRLEFSFSFSFCLFLSVFLSSN